MEIIKEYIEKNKLNISEFSEIVGISRQHMCNILKGSRDISKWVAVAIEEATNGELSRMTLLWPNEFPKEEIDMLQKMIEDK